MSREPDRRLPAGLPEALLPGAPAYDPADPAESAVVRRLAANWHRRAAVKREEADPDGQFDPDRPDYPERILPFHDHPSYRRLEPGERTRLLAWAWIAYNHRTVQAEQQVVNEAFALVLAGAYPGADGEAMRRAVAQAMVDEQYHTLMHLDASAVTHRRRGLAGAVTDLPPPCTVRDHARLCAEADEPWQRPLITLAFAAVAEMSVNAYLGLLADDTLLQPLNSATVRLHSRDEYCHASITAALAEAVHHHLDARRRRRFLDLLGRGLTAFAATDWASWQHVMELARIPDGRRMLDDCRTDPSRRLLVRDHSGLRTLVDRLGATGQVEFP
ncbi:diiron oxygenase [Kitasatospora sp. NPDC059646]|uniref:diiron oxygenase n=1 Tax=Kitasatospora sp. NPDC059646 TaxID=3346893 RepID=UPI0036CB3E1B